MSAVLEALERKLGGQGFNDEGKLTFTHRFGERMIKVSHAESVHFIDARRLRPRRRG